MEKQNELNSSINHKANLETFQNNLNIFKFSSLKKNGNKTEKVKIQNFDKWNKWNS